jgi:hypothetical protein
VIPPDIQAVLTDLANGASLEKACKPAGRPCKSTILRKVKSDPEIAEAYAWAMEARAEHRVGELIELNEMLIRGETDPQTCRVASENLRWLASKDSSRFAERTRAEITGANGKDLLPPPKEVDLFEEARYLASVLWSAGCNSLDQAKPAALLGGSS